MISGICDSCAKAGVPAKREYGAELAGKARGSEDCLSAKREFRSCEPWRQARVRSLSAEYNSHSAASLTAKKSDAKICRLSRFWVFTPSRQH